MGAARVEAVKVDFSKMGASPVDTCAFKKWRFIRRRRKGKGKHRGFAPLRRWTLLHGRDRTRETTASTERSKGDTPKSAAVTPYCKEGIKRKGKKTLVLRKTQRRSSICAEETKRSGGKENLFWKNKINHSKLILMLAKYVHSWDTSRKSSNEANFYSDSTCASSKKNGNIWKDKGEKEHLYSQRATKKWKPNWMYEKERDLHLINHLTCNASVEVHSLFTFFCTKLKIKDKAYFDKRNMLNKISSREKSSGIQKHGSKNYSTKLNNQYIPKNKVKILNDIKGKPSKAPPPYKAQSTQANNDEQALAEKGQVLEGANEQHHVADTNNSNSSDNATKAFEGEGGKGTTHGDDQSEFNEEQFADELELDDFDSDGNKKEKTYYTDRCMLDKSVKRVSILDKLNIGLEDKKNAKDNSQGVKKEVMDCKNGKVAAHSYASKAEPMQNQFANREKERPHVGVAEGGGGIAHLKEALDAACAKGSGDSGISGNGISGNGNGKAGAYPIENYKMHPPRKGSIKSHPAEEVAMDAQPRRRSGPPENGQTGYANSGQVGCANNGQAGYFNNGQMGYANNGQAGYFMNGQMGYANNGQVPYGLDNQMGYNPYGPPSYQMNYAANFPVSESANCLMNGPANFPVSNEMGGYPNYGSHPNYGNYPNDGSHPNYANFASYPQWANYQAYGNAGGGPAEGGARPSEKNINETNLVAYTNQRKVKYDEDFTLNYILRKCEDDDQFFCSNDGDSADNGAGNKNELKKYTEGMNKLVEQMYFYDNLYDELKICEEGREDSNVTHTIIDTSLNLNVMDEDAEVQKGGKDNQELISQMELKINELEKNIEELKKQKQVNEQGGSSQGGGTAEGEKKKGKRAKGDTAEGGKKSKSSAVIHKLKREIERIKRENMRKKKKAKRRRNGKGGAPEEEAAPKGGQLEKGKADNGKGESGKGDDCKGESGKGDAANQDHCEGDNFNLDQLINTNQLNTFKNEILNNVYYYIYESYDQKDFDVLESLAKKHETKGRKITYDVNLPKHSFKHKRTSSAWFLNPLYENYMLEKEKKKKKNEKG
ncbi:hypothetical protein PVMG_06277 [Plasmodium vivax Mauritania I]|uniref:Uncharacterized protein n=1 Tax=Plasmodium vivax Mauritania I TaxID=1035515 RepID=A0A0J9T6D9_PLAVI|nr:hypothetical protein PVMG_06277 [Plasmodium vivax Mauritania I]